MFMLIEQINDDDDDDDDLTPFPFIFQKIKTSPNRDNTHLRYSLTP